MKKKNNNEEVNKRLVELEDEKLNLVKEKTKIENGISDLAVKRAILVKDKNEIESKLVTVDTEIAQTRRQFKIEGYSTRNLRRMTENEKQTLIRKRESKCERCLTKGKIEKQKHFGQDVEYIKGLECHHKKPLSHGGTNDDDNIEVLCEPCHRKLHRV